MDITHKLDKGNVVKVTKKLNENDVEEVTEQVYTPADIQKGIDTCKAYIEAGKLSEENLLAVQNELKMWQGYGKMVEEAIVKKDVDDISIPKS